MRLKEIIKKILIEQTIDLGKRTSLESVVMGMIEKAVDRNLISTNYYGPVIDIYDTDYGLSCKITFLFKKPFRGKDSDLLHDLGRKLRQEIDMWVPILKGGISIGNSTIDSYLNQKWWYDEKKKTNLKEQSENIIKEETSKSIRLLRRIHNVDELLELKLRIHFGPDSVCKYESDEEFLEVISYSVINTMYWDYFGDIDDNSEEWTSMFRAMEKYIEDKYGDELKGYYRKHCTKKIETKESELTEKCWKGYTQKGMKTMFGKRYPNCVKKNKVLKENTNELTNTQKNILDFIEKNGLAHTIKFMGGYDNIKNLLKGTNLLTREFMLDFIIEVIEEYGSVGCSEIGIDPIVIKINKMFKQISQIEYFTSSGVIVDVYDGHEYDNYMGEYRLNWENVDTNHLYEIFDGFIEWLENLK